MDTKYIWKRALSRAFLAARGRRQITNAAAKDRLGCSETTISRRLHRPSEMSLSDFVETALAYSLDPAEALQEALDCEHAGRAVLVAVRNGNSFETTMDDCVACQSPCLSRSALCPECHAAVGSDE